MLQNDKPNGGFDEMFDGAGSTRAHSRKFRSLLEEIPPDDFTQRRHSVDLSSILTNNTSPSNGCPLSRRPATRRPSKLHPKATGAAVTEFLVLSEDFPRSIRFCVAQLDTAQRKISGVPEGRFVNDAERHAGRLLAELQFSTVEEIFERGLHGYLDDLQIKFNRIGDALFEAYFFLSLAAQGEADFVQQEEQQQQSARPGRAALPSVNPA